ncbi:unnamed protein product [Durusdinium trenchii]|uniref:Uncharacterized protein n=1 Tax=Durusdinium trenchii TaxID=1381693 RepID=A0ABP0P1B9_9DINO
MSRGAWKRDVVTGHQAMTTTGGSTWDAAFRLCDFLEAEWHGGLTPDGPKAVLELGAGTGWLGMTVARNCPCHVCLTEQAEGGAMEWLQENLAQNVAAGLPLQGVTLQELDWNAWEAPGGAPAAASLPRPASGGAWDLLIGSDLIYSEVGVRCLPRVLKSFIEEFPEATMLYCHTLHRFDDFDLEFCRALHDQGLAYQVVAAEGASRSVEVGDDLDPLDDEGQGFLQELFPAQRVVVFHITRDVTRRWFSPSLARCSEGTGAPASVSAKAAEVAEADVVQAFRAQVDPLLPDSWTLGSSHWGSPVLRQLGAVPKQVGQLKIFLPGAEVTHSHDPHETEELVLRLVNLGPFGSGQHPTTFLMLKAMQEMTWAGLSMCDYGCGSGVLGLLALRLGAKRCLGVDNVPDALLAAQDNARANECRIA